MSLDGSVKTRHLYAGRVVSLDLDRIQGPDGRTHELEIVRHPGAAAILPILSGPDERDPLIALIRQLRHAADSDLYEVPAGRLEADEAPVDCARRELREETGFVADSIEPLISFYSTPGFTDERIHAFEASGLTATEPSPDPDESILSSELRLSTALRMIDTGEIRDGKTIAILLFAARKRARQ
jgi:ADP-ribose pyrophosphatase